MRGMIFKGSHIIGIKCLKGNVHKLHMIDAAAQNPVTPQICFQHQLYVAKNMPQSMITF